jgi:hypothetical protein
MRSINHQTEILAALARVYAAEASMPLLSSKTQPGLFTSNASGKAAAQEALAAGLVMVKQTITKGKTTIQLVAITEAGTQYLLAANNPRPVLEQVQTRLVTSERELQQLQLSLRITQQTIESLKHKVEQLSALCQRPTISHSWVTAPAWEEQVARYLHQRQSARPAEDCPLPELYQQARQTLPEMSVGQFHDGLRKLCAERRIALQPWTGPLHELPEPTLALLQGHSLAFYASSLS